MASRHKPRRSHISGIEGVRARARRIARNRSHDNFTELLSGYDASGTPSGPYTGIKLLDEDERHVANNDENRSDFAGSFSKGLDHTPLAGGTGFVVPARYTDFRGALVTVVNAARLDPTLADPASVEAIDDIPRPAANKRPFVNPLSGVGTDLEGVDPLDVTIPEAPPFNGDVAAVEMVELYWMALMRDQPFDQWAIGGTAANQLATAAFTELNTFNQQVGGQFALHYAGPGVWSSDITLARLFRGSAPGNDAGGYVSQFLLRDVPFGTLDFEQKQFLLRSTEDYLIDPAHWDAVQEGGQNPGFPAAAEPGRPDLEAVAADGAGNPLPLPQQLRRHMITLRDLTHYVHFDALHEAYFNAALILSSIPETQLSITNVYERPSRKMLQQGFGTFGGPHILVLLTEVATRALKTVWHQKWYVHRRLRPEGLGGRVHLAKTNGAHASLVDAKVLNSNALQRSHTIHSSYLLPMAFPEGSPMHPSYGAGHATVAGACVTMLKALFEPRIELPEVVMAVDDGTDTGNTALQMGPNTAGLTIGGELNKLAANVAIARNAAGVHYRSDYTKSLALGEAVAMAMLQEMALTFVESEAGLPVWWLPTFDGHWVTIDKKGKLKRQEPPPLTKGLFLRSRNLFSA